MSEGYGFRADRYLKMKFVGGYPNEWCIFIDDLTDDEKSWITSENGDIIDIDREIAKLK